MTSNTVAIVVACISGGVSLAVAILAELARRKLAAWQHKRTTELEGLRSEQAQKLQALKSEKDQELEVLKAGQDKELEALKAGQSKELETLKADQNKELEIFKADQNKELEGLRHTLNRELQRLRSDQDKELEAFRHTLLRRREQQAKADDAAELVAKYRDPLLQSAFDLQSRIHNICQRGFNGRADPEYFRINTLFVLAEFLGWLEILRRDMQFLDLGAEQATKELGRRIERIREQLATTQTLRDDFYVFRGHQRAIGELMITPFDSDMTERRRHQCIGYAAFVEKQNGPEFAKWFERLGRAVERLPDQQPKPERLVGVQHALIKLIDLLDPEYLRFPANRREPILCGGLLEVGQLERGPEAEERKEEKGQE